MHSSFTPVTRGVFVSGAGFRMAFGVEEVDTASSARKCAPRLPCDGEPPGARRSMSSSASSDRTPSSGAQMIAGCHQ